MQRLMVIATVALVPLVVAACAGGPMGLEGPPPPPPPPYSYESPSASTFEARDFAWSMQPGAASINGALAYRSGPVRYSCQGGDVILTPETPWSRRRMIILYGSATAAVVPVSIVRARTPSAPSGDLGRFVKRATCDDSNHFSFHGLPDGAWFVITVGKPLDGRGEGMAISRRVETHGGPRFVTLP